MTGPETIGDIVITRRRSDRMLVHATAISRQSKGVLIAGPSGVGKSMLARHMIERGWKLVGDDQIHIIKGREGLFLAGDSRLKGQLEVRGLGIIPVIPACPAKLVLTVMLSPAALTQPEAPALSFFNLTIPCIILPSDDKGVETMLDYALNNL